MGDHFDWDSVENLLGIIPDKEIADRLGCTRQAVHQQRCKRRIPRCPARVRRVPRADLESADFGLPVADVARSLGVSVVILQASIRESGVSIKQARWPRRTLMKSVHSASGAHRIRVRVGPSLGYDVERVWEVQEAQRVLLTRNAVGAGRWRQVASGHAALIHVYVGQFGYHAGDQVLVRQEPGVVVVELPARA